jgi:hypothetical protein
MVQNINKIIYPLYILNIIVSNNNINIRGDIVTFSWKSEIKASIVTGYNLSGQKSVCGKDVFL